MLTSARLLSWLSKISLQMIKLMSRVLSWLVALISNLLSSNLIDLISVFKKRLSEHSMSRTEEKMV